jgi:predicted acetyltransferase
MVEIRELNEGDLAAWVRIGAQAYRRGDLGDAMPRWPEGGFTRLGLFEDGQQVAQCHLWDYEIYFGARRVPMNGVASVACLPLARGKGYTEALLSHGLRHMRERGQPLSMLHAFLVGLYRPMGWEWVGSARNYTLPLSCLPAGLEPRHVRLAGPEDAATLRDLYDAEAVRYRGMLVRSLLWWQGRLEATTGYTNYFYLYDPGTPQGYLYLHLRDPASVRELYARTPEAYRALLGVLRRHKAQLDRFTWRAAPDDPLWHYAAHWDLKVEWSPPYSARVVDLAAALQAGVAPEAPNGRCVVRIVDRQASWNDGGWEITAEDGTVSARKTSAEPHVACDIGAWSQLTFRDPDAEALRRAGRLEVFDEAGYAWLMAAFPPALCWTNDGF